jgi:hypothetical protein
MQNRLMVSAFLLLAGIALLLGLSIFKNYLIIFYCIALILFFLAAVFISRQSNNVSSLYAKQADSVAIDSSAAADRQSRSPYASKEIVMLRAFGLLIAALCCFAALMIFIVFGHESQYALGWLIFGAMFLFLLIVAWRSFQQAKRR